MEAEKRKDSAKTKEKVADQKKDAINNEREEAMDISPRKTPNKKPNHRADQTTPKKGTPTKSTPTKSKRRIDYTEEGKFNSIFYICQGIHNIKSIN